VIPTLNDSEDHFGRLAKWVSENLGRETPLHLSAYFPRHRLTIGPTPVETLERAFGICSQYLDHVYLGNAAASVGRDTTCGSCGALLVSRRGYQVELRELEGTTCRQCGAAANIVTN